MYPDRMDFFCVSGKISVNIISTFFTYFLLKSLKNAGVSCDTSFSWLRWKKAYQNLTGCLKQITLFSIRTLLIRTDEAEKRPKFKNVLISYRGSGKVKNFSFGKLLRNHGTLFSRLIIIIRATSPLVLCMHKFVFISITIFLPCRPGKRICASAWFVRMENSNYTPNRH